MLRQSRIKSSHRAWLKASLSPKVTDETENMSFPQLWDTLRYIIRKEKLNMSIIKDESMYKSGLDKINWVKSYMPILSAIEREVSESRPFEGLSISMSIHLEAKTAYLAMVLKSAGAEVYATGCNPLSTQDDVAAALVHEGIEVFAVHGATEEMYKEHLIKALEVKPHLIIDDGGDFTALLHGEYPHLAERLIGGCEETTTGIHRLRARAADNTLRFPMMNVNDADCKHLFDNRYGTGQSTLDGIMNTTNLIIAGKTVVIAGYGWCGRGAAMRAKGMGARVIVTEIDPVKAIEAVMDGYTVMPMDEAAQYGDLFITLTGCRDVITGRHFEKMKDGALLANSGHFDLEIDKKALSEMCTEEFERKVNIRAYRMKSGKIINLLAEGRLVNLAAGNGHPAEIMDMSFAIQARGLLYLLENKKKLKPGLYSIPSEIDKEVARTKLASAGIKIDSLTEEQKQYLSGYGI